ncbi:MAG: undecaprenyldiphospho-muramoylpentapeptide beta-N-acetylglucosaminyltransferase [Clostridia bacterium]|nr:undecaprenyldiphospho-muramoylpentapeptide beta-N-acetylglucosaminyltransferase [Clostridia bacterium]
MKVVMTGGGTAGHVNPALSIAQIIESGCPGSTLRFIGTRRGLESKLVPKAGYPLYEIEVQGLRRSLSPSNFKVLWKAYASYRQCRKMFKEDRPDLVVGTGGYVSWPVCRAAASLGIPTALHESNAEPGFAVKMLKNSADVIFVNFADTERFLIGSKAKIVHVGMPIHRDFTRIDREEARRGVDPEGKWKQILLSFGGSLGAAHLNEAMLEFMATYMKAHPEVLLIHSAGSRGYTNMKAKFEEMGLDRLDNIRLMEYIYDMPRQMVAADVVICRSGASTLSELTAIRKASILIPSPNVTNNQQYKNAALLADKGAALLLPDAELTGAKLCEMVDRLFGDADALQAMEAAAGTFAVADTEEKILKTLKDIVK